MPEVSLLHEEPQERAPPERLRVGMIGTGVVSEYYVEGCRAFRDVEIVACADLDTERAAAKAGAWSIEALGVDELLDDPGIDVVLNLTPPRTHAFVTLGALGAGKHVYSEKPLATTLAEGVPVVEAAAASGARLGSAPDTFLGPAQQTCRNVIDSGGIGRPVAVTACMVARGAEDWHPTPDFLFQPGGGPLLDMGPYYVTALVHLLGPVARVHGLARAPSAERIVQATGARIPVSVPTHVTGMLEFADGAVATILLSWEGWATEHPCIEVYGDEATLSVPDPNEFSGPVRVRGAGESWTVVRPVHDAEYERGVGVADLAHALRTGAAHRASGELALHILEVLCALEESSQADRPVELRTTCSRPAPLPVDLLARASDG